MLGAADASLARRDRAIPGLSTVLDADALVAALHAAYPELGIQRASPFYAHYKPGTRCIVAFRMTTADAGSELLAYADAYGPDAAVKLPKAQDLAQRHTGPLGQDALLLDTCDVALYVFPTDRRLGVLRRLAQPDKRANLLRRLFRKQPEYGNSTLQHLRYKPERRYVALLETADGRRAVIKFYNAKGYREAKRGAQAFSSRGALRLVPCAGYLDEHQVLAFDWQPGYSLHNLLCEIGGGDSGKQKALENTGAALAELHGQTPGHLEQRTRDAERQRLDAQAVTVAQLCPELREMASRLVRDFATRLEDTPLAEVALHGDFNAQQVLIGNDPRATILDLDWAVRGDPAADLGQFVARLEREVLRGVLSSAQVGLFADALVEGYGSVRVAPAAVSIQLYTAIGLFYLAAEPFRYREPGWPEQIEALLARAGAILDDCCATMKAHTFTTA